MSNFSAPRHTRLSTDTGRVLQKQRTKRLLLDTARALITSGARPTVAEVADAALVSRRTAYRYFPTQRKLLADAALDGLRPIMEAAIAADKPKAGFENWQQRLDILVEKMQGLTLENESLLRTMIHETVLNEAGARPSRGGRRIEWIEMAIKPLRPRLGGAGYARLVSALALCMGIEAMLVLRDICGLSPRQAVEVSQWMARTMVRQSLAECGATKRRRRS